MRLNKFGHVHMHLHSRESLMVSKALCVGWLCRCSNGLTYEGLLVVQALLDHLFPPRLSEHWPRLRRFLPTFRGSGGGGGLVNPLSLKPLGERLALERARVEHSGWNGERGTSKNFLKGKLHLLFWDPRWGLDFAIRRVRINASLQKGKRGT